MQIKQCKGVLLFVVIVLIAAGCKKKQYQDCTSCSCINDKLSYNDTLIDSAAFYQAIIGTWYVKEFDTFLIDRCNSHCYCDTSFPVTILDSKTLSISFLGNPKDTFSYTFRISGNKVDPGSGVFEVPAILSQFQPVWLRYNSGYILIYTQTLSPGTLDFPPNYILTRQ